LLPIHCKFSTASQRRASARGIENDLVVLPQSLKERQRAMRAAAGLVLLHYITEAPLPIDRTQQTFLPGVDRQQQVPVFVSRIQQHRYVARRCPIANAQRPRQSNLLRAAYNFPKLTGLSVYALWVDGSTPNVKDQYAQKETDLNVKWTPQSPAWKRLTLLARYGHVSQGGPKDQHEDELRLVLYYELR